MESIQVKFNFGGPMSTLSEFTKNNELFIFRKLQSTDTVLLGNFFTSLSDETRGRFGPHPLTKEHAEWLCSQIDETSIERFIIDNNKEVVGYFIIDFNLFKDEKQRYSSYGINLDSRKDPVFAPCISDKYQNKGIASEAMRTLIEYAHKINIRNLVLMGGTQVPNKIAIRFYKKFGFREYGRFYTEHNGLNNLDMMLTIKNS